MCWILGYSPQNITYRLDIWKNLFPKGCEALEWAAQGGGRVPVPGGLHKVFRCRAQWCGLVEDWSVLAQRLDWVTLEISSNPDAL